MRILILANKLPYPPLDGGSIATLNMITGLKEAGNEMTVLSLNTRKHIFPVEKIPGELTGSIRFLSVDCDSSLRPVPMILNLIFSRKSYIAQRFNIREFRNRLRTLLEREKFDVVQLEGPYTGHYLDIIRTASKAAVSLRAHNVEHLIWQRKAVHEKSVFKRWYLNNMAARLKRFEMDVVTRCDCLVTISPLDEAYFCGNGYSRPSITIATGFKLEEYPGSALPAEKNIFFIGALDWLPNQEGLTWFLENVFGELTAIVPDLMFHIAGRNAPGYFEKKLRDKNIVYHGEVEDAREFIQSFRVMVAPLFTASGIRIKILESMALCRPVVTTSVGVKGIPAENDRHILVADTPEMFKLQIISLLDDNSKATRLVSRARQVISQNFDTFELSNRLSRFFKEQV